MFLKLPPPQSRVFVPSTQESLRISSLHSRLSWSRLSSWRVGCRWRRVKPRDKRNKRRGIDTGSGAPPQCMPVWFFNSFRLYPHMFSTYVPSGDSKDLLAALMATSPRKSPAPRKSIASGSAKRRKSTKTSMNDNTSNGAADDPTHDMEKQTKAKKSKDRKSIKATNSSEEQTQCEGPTATLRIFGGAYHTMCSRSK